MFIVFLSLCIEVFELDILEIKLLVYKIILKLLVIDLFILRFSVLIEFWMFNLCIVCLVFNLIIMLVFILEL